MKNLFVTREQAIKLENIGFDELCFAGYDNDTHELYIGFEDGMCTFNRCFYTSAPTIQQTLDWFEMEWSMYVDRLTNTTPNEILDFTYKIKSWKFSPIKVGEFEDNREGLEITIDTLIELVSGEYNPEPEVSFTLSEIETIIDSVNDPKSPGEELKKAFEDYKKVNGDSKK